MGTLSGGLVACGGESPDVISIDGGSAGRAGAGGSGGRAGSSGSAGAGTAGSVTSDASNDVQANPDVVEETSKADSPPDAVAADAPRDVSQEGSTSDGALPDAMASDSTVPDVAPADGGGSDVVTTADAPAETGPASCPATQPPSDSDCPQNGLLCDYADAGGQPCVCRTISAGVRHWSCFGLDASAPDCPPPQMKPTTGQTCNDAGVSYACRYGNSWCFCNETSATPNTWQCI